MVIKEERPVSMAEVSAIVGEGEKAESIKNFIKQFETVSFEDAQKMKEELTPDIMEYMEKKNKEFITLNSKYQIKYNKTNT